jgi:chemotaxis protein CheD
MPALHSRPAARGYFDKRFNAQIINVAPGDHDMASLAGEILSTVLGSCVAACLRDPFNGIGGMNHFLLPGEEMDATQPSSSDMRFGTASMEVLINALIKRGAIKSRLEAKIFGGAVMMGSPTAASVGARNAAFAIGFLDREGIPILARDLGGDCPRRANYEPATGRAWVNRLPGLNARAIVAAESAYRQTITNRNPVESLEIF